MEKKGKASTIVFSVLLAVAIVLFCFNCYMLHILNPHRYGELDSSGAMAMLAATLFGSMTVIGCLVYILVISSLGLKFCIRNIKSDSKPIRVINIVLTCCFSAGLVSGILAIILLGVFVL